MLVLPFASPNNIDYPAIVYATPEGLLKSERWRHMLTNKVYREKLCAIAVDEAHVIKQW
jgi:superfamily II DNA helicase RecQ